jgi:hypothetical protein
MEIYRFTDYTGTVIDYKEEDQEIFYYSTSQKVWVKSWYEGMRGVRDWAIKDGWKQSLMKHDPNDIQLSNGCCNGGIGLNPVYSNGKWHDEECPEMKQQSFKLDKELDIYSPKKTGCTCGSTAVGSDRHSDYCDLYKKG